MSCSRSRRRSRSWRVSENRGRFHSSRTPERRRISPKYRGPLHGSERRTRSTRYSDYRDSYYRRSQSPGRRRYDSSRNHRSPNHGQYRRIESRGNYHSSRQANDDYEEYRRGRRTPRRHPESWQETTSQYRRDYDTNRRSVVRSSSRTRRDESRYHRTRTPSISRDRSISPEEKYHAKRRHGIESRGSERSSCFSRRSGSHLKVPGTTREVQGTDPNDAKCRDSRSQESHKAGKRYEGSPRDSAPAEQGNNSDEKKRLDCQDRSKQTPECPTPDLAPASTLDVRDDSDTRPRETSTKVDSESTDERKVGISESQVDSETQGKNCEIGRSCTDRHRSKSRSAASHRTNRSQRYSERRGNGFSGDRGHGDVPVKDVEGHTGNMEGKREVSGGRDFDTQGNTCRADADEHDLRRSIHSTSNTSLEKHGSRDDRLTQHKRGLGHHGDRSESRGRLASGRRRAHSPLDNAQKVFRGSSLSREMVGQASRVSDHWGWRGQGNSRRSIHSHDYPVHRQRMHPASRRWGDDQSEYSHYNTRAHTRNWGTLRMQEFPSSVHPSSGRRYIRAMGNRPYGREVPFVVDHTAENPFTSPWSRGGTGQQSTPGVSSGGASLKRVPFASPQQQFNGGMRGKPRSGNVPEGKWSHDLFEQLAREPEQKKKRRFNLYGEKLEVIEE